MGAADPDLLLLLLLQCNVELRWDVDGEARLPRSGERERVGMVVAKQTVDCGERESVRGRECVYVSVCEKSDEWMDDE